MARSSLNQVDINMVQIISSSLFQALCQCGRFKKRVGDERGLVEKEGATGELSRPLPFFSPGSRSQLIPLVG